MKRKKQIIRSALNHRPKGRCVTARGVKKKNLAIKKHASLQGVISYRLLLIGIILLLIVGVFFFFYQSETGHVERSHSKTYFAQLLSVFSSDPQTEVPPQQWVDSPSLHKSFQETPIHFEFYTSLPNMQMDMSSQKEEAVLSAKRSLSNPEALQHKNNRLVSALESSKGDSVSKEKLERQPAIRQAMPIVSADELEQELSTHIKQAAYIVQLGRFKEMNEAKQYQLYLAKLHIPSHLEKISHGSKVIYGLQVGPFNSKQQASVALKSLKKKGIAGMLIKTAAS